MCECIILRKIIEYFQKHWCKYTKLDDKFDNELKKEEVHEDVVSDYVLIHD